MSLLGLLVFITAIIVLFTGVFRLGLFNLIWESTDGSTEPSPTPRSCATTTGSCPPLTLKAMRETAE
jgi:hypothetical protein